MAPQPVEFQIRFVKGILHQLLGDLTALDLALGVAQQLLDMSKVQRVKRAVIFRRHGGTSFRHGG